MAYRLLTKSTNHLKVQIYTCNFYLLRLIRTKLKPEKETEKDTPKKGRYDSDLVRKEKLGHAKAAPVLWNDLPLHVRAVTSLDAFKTKLKTHLFVQTDGAIK